MNRRSDARRRCGLSEAPKTQRLPLKQKCIRLCVFKTEAIGSSPKVPNKNISIQRFFAIQQFFLYNQRNIRAGSFVYTRAAESRAVLARLKKNPAVAAAGL